MIDLFKALTEGKKLRHENGGVIFFDDAGRLVTEQGDNFVSGFVDYEKWNVVKEKELTP